MSTVTKWVLAPDDKITPKLFYCIPAGDLGLFSIWINTRNIAAEDLPPGYYDGPDFSKFSIGADPLFLTFENPELQDKPWAGPTHLNRPGEN